MMRDDLSRACVRCALRLPEQLARCPWCGRAPGSVAAALAEDGRTGAQTSARSALRERLLWLPAGVFLLATPVLAVLLPLELAVELWRAGSGASAVMAFVLCWPLMFAAAAIVLTFVWCCWAPFALAVAWLFGRRAERIQLRVAPFPKPGLVVRSLEARRERFMAFVRARKRRLIMAAIVVLLLTELVFELAGPEPFFVGRRPASALLVVVGFLLAHAFFGCLSLLSLMIGSMVVKPLVPRLVATLALPGSPSKTPGPELDGGRASAEGVASALDGSKLEAPLSGAPCLAYRLCGRIGPLEIDDAQIVPLRVAAAPDAVVRGSAHVVVLPAPSSERRELTEGQIERVRQLLRGRGIELTPFEVTLGEALLIEGDRVRVHGALGSEPAAGADYRGRGTRAVLDDSDGQPVLIERLGDQSASLAT